MNRFFACACIAILGSACQGALQSGALPVSYAASVTRGSAGGEKILYDFQDGSDGAFPMDSLIVDAHGNLYGTAANAGGANECSIHCGAVFELSPSGSQKAEWTFTTLYNFKGGSDGGLPEANLAFGPGGSLFGTTAVGGAQLKYNGRGVAFALKPVGSHWTESVLHAFGRGSDGRYPHGGLITDKHGNLFGTAVVGGSGNCLGGCGNVYELSPPGNGHGAWTETVLHGFVGGSDGGWPQAGLAVDRTGHLFGTTEFGGYYSTFCGSGCGTVFELSPASSGSFTYAVIHRFAPGVNGDGALPFDPVTLDKAGNLYGTASEGLPQHPGYAGVAFKLKRPAGSGQRWAETILYSFPQYANDAAYPKGGLTFDAAGNLYGTSEVGGTSENVGTVFELVPPSGSKHSWTDVLLYRFTRAKHGAIYPETSVIFGPGNFLYGTTPQGGSGSSPACVEIKNKGCGTVFTVSP